MPTTTTRGGEGYGSGYEGRSDRGRSDVGGSGSSKQQAATAAASRRGPALSRCGRWVAKKLGRLLLSLSLARSPTAIPRDAHPALHSLDKDFAVAHLQSRASRKATLSFSLSLLGTVARVSPPTGSNFPTFSSLWLCWAVFLFFFFALADPGPIFFCPTFDRWSFA